MNTKRIVAALAGVLALLFTGCATDDSAEFGKITTTAPGHSTDPTRSGESSGVGFVHRY